MKKIVALVLALVLALSLATVAFAKTTAELKTDMDAAKIVSDAAAAEVDTAKAAVARWNEYKQINGEGLYYVMGSFNGLTEDQLNANKADAAKALEAAELLAAAKLAVYNDAKAAYDAAMQAVLDAAGNPTPYSAKTLTAAEAWNDAYGDAYTVSIEAYGSAPYTEISGLDKFEHLQEYKVVVTNKETKAQSQTEGCYILAANEKSASLVVVKGSTITYLAAVANGLNRFNTVSNVATAVATKAVTADGITCGDIVTATGIKLYKSGSTYYKAAANTANTWMLVDGKAMAVVRVGEAVAYDSVAAAKAAASDNDVAKVAHKYVIEGTYAKTGAVQTVTKVYCSTCKAEFAFVVGSKADAVAKFGSNGYVDTLIDTVDGDSIFVKDTSAAAAAGTTAVSSAKTFDAGIALYVGMSISAVAGSAVVIGKKKEF